jgi:hypothetical protein
MEEGEDTACSGPIGIWKKKFKSKKISLISNQTSNAAGGAWNCEPSLGQQKYGIEDIGQTKK